MQIGTLLRSLGAIGVNRRENTNFVDTAVKMFKEEEQLFLIIAPEGGGSPTHLSLSNSPIQAQDLTATVGRPDFIESPKRRESQFYLAM